MTKNIKNISPKTKILFWGNQSKREIYIINSIIKELKNVNSCIDVKVMFDEMDTNSYWEAILYKPNIIITYPITTDYQIRNYIITKLLINPIIICYTTEGIFDYKNPEVFRLFLGMYDYPSWLVDYHFFWGRKVANLLGREMINRKRIESWKQIKVVGYPMYEEGIYKGDLSFVEENIRIQNERKKYTKCVMFATGFHCANVTKNDISGLADVVNVKNVNTKEFREEVNKYYDEIVEPLSEYRNQYIDCICKLAMDNDNILFLVKLHPLEIEQLIANRANPYKQMQEYKNIVLLDKNIPLKVYLDYIDIFFHYGSTTGLEAYIHGVPTVQLQPMHKHIFLETTFESTRIIMINKYKEIEDICKKGIKFVHIQSVKKYLYDFMNYRFEIPYTPSKEIAHSILSSKKWSKVDIASAYVKKNILNNNEIVSKIVEDLIINFHKNQIKGICKDIYYYLKWIVIKYFCKLI